jgi:hypothetical protein
VKLVAQWDEGKGSHHPDYDPHAKGNGVIKASRETEELLNAIVKVRAHRTSSRRAGLFLRHSRSQTVVRPVRTVSSFFFFFRNSCS